MQHYLRKSDAPPLLVRAHFKLYDQKTSFKRRLRKTSLYKKLKR